MKPLVIARCGDSECFPENTLPAFESAIKKGADAVEFDVHQTSDGGLIVHHFYNLGSSDNGAGLVCEHTLAELKSLDSGSWFAPEFAGLQKPTLEEVLELCKGKVRLEIEVKSSGLDALEQIIGELERFKVIDGVELTTAHYPLLLHAEKLNPRLCTGTFFYGPPDWMPLRLAQQHSFDWSQQLDIQVVHIADSLLTADFIEVLHQKAFRVHGSNLDNEEQIRRGLSLGIDGFSTGSLSKALKIRGEDTLRPKLG
jgi:glycerophosphoryl diester phosphodiesterase